MPSKLGFFLRSSLGLFTRSPLGFRDTSKRYTLTDCDGVLDDIATTAQRAFNVDGTHIDLDLQIGRVVTILDKCFEVAVWQEGDPTEFKIIAVVATSTDCAGCSPTSPDIGFMAVRCTADSTPSPGAAIIWGKGDLSAFEGMVVTLEPGVAYKLGEGAIQGVPTACDTNTPVRCLYIVPAADQLEFYQQSSGQADSGSVGSFLNKCDFTPYESSDVIESYADCEACAEDYPPEDPDPPGDPEPDPDCNSRYFRLFECSCGYTPYYIQLCRNTSIRAGQYNGKCYAVIHPGITESTFNALSGIDVTGDFSGAVTSLQISGCDSLTASACPYYRRATLCSDSTVNVWVDRSEAEALGLTSGSTPVFVGTDGVCYQYRDDNQTQCPERKGRTVVTIETARGAFANCGACGPLFVMEDADGVQSDRTVSPANQSTDLAAVAATTWASLADSIQSVEFNGTCWTVRAWITGDSTTVQATVVDSQHATVADCNITTGIVPDWDSNPDAEYAIRFSDVQLCECTVLTNASSYGGRFTGSISDSWLYHEADGTPISDVGAWWESNNVMELIYENDNDCSESPTRTTDLSDPSEYGTVSIWAAFPTAVELSAGYSIIFARRTVPSLAAGESSTASNDHTGCRGMIAGWPNSASELNRGGAFGGTITVSRRPA